MVPVSVKNNQATIITYHSCDHNVMETCLRSLRSVSDCMILVITDDVSLEIQKEWTTSYGVEWLVIDPSEMTRRRMFCKLKWSYHCLGLCPDGTQVLVADADLYFLKDPFQAFIGRSFHVGLSTRPTYSPCGPINGGVHLYRVADSTREFCRITLEQILLTPPQSGYATYRERFPKHAIRGLDWWVDQDWLNAVHEFNLLQDVALIETIGPEYNWSPRRLSEEGQLQLLAEYRKKKVAVLHLRGRLKKLVYDHHFEHAVVRFKPTSHNWGAE